MSATINATSPPVSTRSSVHTLTIFPSATQSITFTPTHTASRTTTATLTDTLTKTRIPTLTHTYTPTRTLTPTQTPTATSAPPLETPGVLDRKDPLSLVRWLKYGLDHQDLSYIEPLLAEDIYYSLAFSDFPGEHLSKETFVSELVQRFANHPGCISYNIGIGEINRLFIATGEWNPTWEFDGAEWDALILDFSDQDTKEDGLYLFGAYVTLGWWTNPPNWIPCR